MASAWVDVSLPITHEKIVDANTICSYTCYYEDVSDAILFLV